MRASSLWAQIDAALSERLSRKTRLNAQSFEYLSGDLRTFYYLLYAQAFGMKENTLPFIELCHKLPLKLLWKENERSEAMLWGVAGFFQQKERFSLQKQEADWLLLKHKYALAELDFCTWKFKGMRPTSFPDKQLKRFAIVCRQEAFFCFEDKDVEQIMALFRLQAWSENFANHLLINVAVPILWWNYQRLGNEHHREKAIQILQGCPAESNHIIHNWKKMGVRCKTSFETQGLLEIKNELCTNKKCLSCKLSSDILKA